MALQQAAAGFPWLRSTSIRVVLSLRAVEVLAVAVGATLGTHGFRPVSGQFTLNDSVAMFLILSFSFLLIATVWKGTGELGNRSRSQYEIVPPSGGQ